MIVPRVLMFLSAIMLERRAGSILGMFGGMMSMTGTGAAISVVAGAFSMHAYAAIRSSIRRTPSAR
jgi:hypothetical protein